METKKFEEKCVVADALRGMQVGDVYEFPISRMVTVRVTSCNIGLMEDKKFATRTNKEQRTVTVTREA